MEAAILPLSSIGKISGTGGFLDPENITDKFKIKEGMRIADFGCGAGYFTIALAERTGSDGLVTALDVQEYALDSVRSKARMRNLSNIETVRTNLEVVGSSGLADNSQDFVLLANILFQSQENPSIIKEAYRVLKKGGTMVIIDWKKSGGGFGPPDELRLSQDAIKETAEKLGFNFENPFDAGFHFGLRFNKK